MEVEIWQERVVIPTYGTGEPEKNPVFLEHRVYQGSSGVVYPYPVIEKILDHREDKQWIGLFLENKYLKIMILPELGGRIQMAWDKIGQRHFVYYNQVIKPALVGLAGPWISGGIEFNWPQHHRPGTYEPVDFTLTENRDGSKTIWISEVERMTRTRGMAGFTLYPDKAYLEIRVKLYNRTPFPQSFLWWANPAVKVNEEYQSVFPPDVHTVFDHGRRDVSTFPVATGTYYKIDYSAGVDISRYRNIPVPTSFMAVSSKYDFVGGYEHDTQAGLLHVADHHVSPGKKQWTWGNGEFGRAWDRNLTDEDGPYIELMCGVYTDNQPDFSWLMPYEEKDFVQYFMPYREVGLVKNASKDVILNLEIEEGQAMVKIAVTAEYPGSFIRLGYGNTLIFKDEADLTPETCYLKTEVIPENSIAGDFHLSVHRADGSLMLEWRPETEKPEPFPEPAQAAKDPEETMTTEQLYLQGLHLEQYRHATFDPAVYYHEALRRDPTDIRSNNAMGLLLMRKSQFREAEYHFRTAIKKTTRHNPNPFDGEPFFNLGVCLRMQGRIDEAYDAFYKSVWNGAWQEAGYLQLARISCLKGNYSEALDQVNRSLLRNTVNHQARHLKIALLRLLGDWEQALVLAGESLEMDPFNFGARFEQYLLSGGKAILEELKSLIRDYVHNYIEFSLDYTTAGLYAEAADFLAVFIDDKPSVYPMAWYLKGWNHHLGGGPVFAAEAFEIASVMPPGYCFPSRAEELLALEAALKINPEDARAWYYLGNYWYASRHYGEAIRCWETSAGLDLDFPTVFRNLSLAYYNKQQNPKKALASMEKAFELDQSDSRVLMELDQLYKKTGKSDRERLDLLEKHPKLVEYRDDLYLEYATLLNRLGQEDQALGMLVSRKFHPWEGGEGKVTAQYVNAHIGLAKKAMEERFFGLAIEHLEAAQVYPDNLGEGKLPDTRENHIFYWLGHAYEGLGSPDHATRCWELAAQGNYEPSIAMYYNDFDPEMIYYQGLALLKLGREPEARGKFNKLLKYGEKQLFKPFKIDYFAVSLPDMLIFDEDLQERHKRHCLEMMELGRRGLAGAD